MEKHLRTVHEKPKYYVIKFCYVQKGNLVSTDIRTVYENLQTFKCDSCDKRFGQNQDFMKHVKIIHGNMKKIKLFKCNSCYKSFGQKGDLNRHVKTVHEPQVFIIFLSLRFYVKSILGISEVQNMPF